MSQVARRHDRPLRNDDGGADTAWSGEVHGEVAALHHAIESRLLDTAQAVAGDVAERPVDALLRTVSRATGWACLALGFVGAGAAIF